LQAPKPQKTEYAGPHTNTDGRYAADACAEPSGSAGQYRKPAKFLMAPLGGEPTPRAGSIVMRERMPGAQEAAQPTCICWNCEIIRINPHIRVMETR